MSNNAKCQCNFNKPEWDMFFVCRVCKKTVPKNKVQQFMKYLEENVDYRRFLK